jgi:uncharacterized protein YaeQ
LKFELIVDRRLLDHVFMTIRASIVLGEHTQQLTLFPVLQETDEHVALKLAAYVLFHALQPSFETSLKHPALEGQDYVPDLMAFDLQNRITLWMECGKTTVNKLSKVRKRYRAARVIVLTTQPREGGQQREELEREGLAGVEIWAFPEGAFRRWQGLIRESNDIIGEAAENSLNLVVNNDVFVTDLQRIS